MVRVLLLALSSILTIVLIYILGSAKLTPVALGKLLSPQEGFWQNAEAVNQSYDDVIRFTELKGKVDVYYDERLVPHIVAEEENDAYFVQGYLHAKFRLWQMEFQTHAAAGRISEIIGDRAIGYDRNQRRKGLVYGAEQMLKSIETDPEVLAACDAYTAGVNSYIESLSSSELPVEYKLLGYQPEKWNNLKTALFIKAMTNDLAGYDHDFEYTHALRVLGEEKFNLLFPAIPDSLSPIIPKGTQFARPDTTYLPPRNADSVYFHTTDSLWFTDEFKPDPANGSNNWVVSGTKTQSGKPILANDPHLNLSFPSIWFEIQISTPTYNSYGVSFPGIPAVVIGFNENIAFGFTNAGRDVKDYYKIKFKDETRSEYWFENAWKQANQRVEVIKVKGKADILDTVAYTIFGPVIFDESNKDRLNTGDAYALRWVAHDPSNALRMWLLLNRAKNYEDYSAAIKYLNVPGQNIVYADRSGDIALWAQANFPLRWKGQGQFLMPGTDSSYMWHGYIPQQQNPHVHNPAEGFVGSANQRPVDSTYPYFIPGSYDVYRGITLNKALAGMQSITVDDMKKLQNNNFNVFASEALPILLMNIETARLDAKEKEYLEILSNWNFYNDPQEKGPVCFNTWWDSLQAVVYDDDLNRTAIPVIRPERFVLLEGLLRDSVYRFVDNVNTPEVESLSTMVTSAFKRAATVLKKIEGEGKLEWAKSKNTTIFHLLRDGALSFARTGIMNGGGYGILNATQHTHGPSWRMVVHMTTPVAAEVVYPGGQSGNPGSPYYDNFVDTWAEGKYYTAWIMKPGDANDSRVKWHLQCRP